MERLYLVIGTGAFFDRHDEMLVGAECVRLATLDEHQARDHVDNLNAWVSEHEARHRLYWERHRRIHAEEVCEFISDAPKGDDPGYLKWQTAAGAAFTRFRNRVEAELGDPPPYRPEGMADRYVMIAMPLGLPVDIRLKDVIPVSRQAALDSVGMVSRPDGGFGVAAPLVPPQPSSASH